MTTSGWSLALATFGLWTAATWLLEGRTQTFLRPEADADRFVYALVVNLLLGVAGSIAVLHALVRRHRLQPHRCGFGSPVRTLAATAVGLALGAGSYVAQGAPSTDPMVVLNAYSQVFVVSAAEVLVCWSLVACTVEARLEPRMGRAATVAAGVAAAALFGLYHFAHSPPFNTWAMVAVLFAVGLFTGAFFFVSRDAIATVVFHNFLGMFGVTRALVEADKVQALQMPRWPLLGMAVVTLLLLMIGHALLRRARGRTA